MPASAVARSSSGRRRRSRGLADEHGREPGCAAVASRKRATSTAMRSRRPCAAAFPSIRLAVIRPVILRDDAGEQLLDDLDEDQDHQRREVDPAEVRKDAADRPVERRGDAVDCDGEGAHALRAGVENVEGEQPAQNDLADDDPGDDAEQQVGDVDEGDEHGGDLAGTKFRAQTSPAALRPGRSAKSPAGSLHSATGVHPPASSSRRAPRGPYLWLFSTWIESLRRRRSGGRRL